MRTPQRAGHHKDAGRPGRRSAILQASAGVSPTRSEDMPPPAGARPPSPSPPPVGCARLLTLAAPPSSGKSRAPPSTPPDPDAVPTRRKSRPASQHGVGVSDAAAGLRMLLRMLSLEPCTVRSTLAQTLPSAFFASLFLVLFRGLHNPSTSYTPVYLNSLGVYFWVPLTPGNDLVPSSHPKLCLQRS